MSEVKFYAQPHKYYYNDKELISVSHLVKKFEPKEDWKKIATKYANKHGESAQYWLDKWEDKSIQSKNAGTLLHEVRENNLINTENPEFFGVVCNVLPCSTLKGVKYSIPINNLPINTVFPELIISDIEAGVSGQSDKVITTESHIHILDYKGLELNTEIPTIDGFKLIKDIKVGDIIFDGEGNTTKIKHVSDIHYNPCYKLIFDTNEEIVCDHEHKWVITKRLAKNKYKDLELNTDTLYNNYLSGQSLAIKISAINIEKDVKLPIDPYVLGVWLGDGNSHFGRVTNINPNLWKEIENRGYNLGKNISTNSGKAEDRTIFGLEKELNKLNLIKNKHIPDLYLRASYSQRLDLLRGFMDTDGSWNKKRNLCVMTTTRLWQAKGLAELVNSLGYKASIVKAKTSGFGKENIDCFHVNFKTKENPFLTRNLDYIYKDTELSKFRYIKSIEKIDTVPTKCLSVDSENHTYLATRNYIKTHNTDEEIKFKGYSSQWKAAKKYLPPLGHLDVCNGNEYALKMSMYMYMVWKQNKHLKPGKLVIEQIKLKRDEEGIPILEDGLPVSLGEKQIELPYLKNEVIAILAHLKEQNNLPPDDL